KVDRIAHDERVVKMDYDLAHGGDAASYVYQATALTQEYGLDYLAVTQPDGTIISSAQWPAHFGYQDASAAVVSAAPYLKREQLGSDKTEVGLFASRSANATDENAGLRVAGGERLDS